MLINDLLNAIKEVKAKAEELGVEIETYSLWSDNITFEEVSEGFGNPIFAEYDCELDELEFFIEGE